MVKETPESFTSNFAYPIIHPKRDIIVKKLMEAQVEVRPLVCGAMNKQPFYKKDTETLEEFNNCDLVYEQGFYLPNNPSLTDKEISYICDIINEQIK